MIGLILLFVAFRLSGGTVATKTTSKIANEKSTQSNVVDSTMDAQEDVIGDALEASSIEESEKAALSKEESTSKSGRSLEDIEREMGLR